MSKSFQENVSAALTGIFQSTVKHPYKRGYYVSTFKVFGKTWEIMHKGKKLIETKIYAVRCID